MGVSQPWMAITSAMAQHGVDLCLGRWAARLLAASLWGAIAFHQLPGLYAQEQIPSQEPPVSALGVENSNSAPRRLMGHDSLVPQPATIITASGAAPTTPTKAKHYIFQVQVIEVDEQGVQTVVATPRIQTTGTPSGFVTEKPDGQRFEFTVAVSNSFNRPAEVSTLPAAIPPAVAAAPVGSVQAPRSLGGTAEQFAAMPQIGSSPTPDANSTLETERSQAKNLAFPDLPDLPPSPVNAAHSRPRAFIPNDQAAPLASSDVMGSSPSSASSPGSVGRAPAGQTEPVITSETVLDRLSKKITVSLTNETRRSALRKVAEEAGVNIVIDPAALVSSRPKLDDTVTLNIADQPADEVIEQLVAAAELAYAVKHEIVLIGHAEQLRPKPEDYFVKTYPAGELAPLVNGQPDFDALVSEIQASVQPKSWKGPNSGSIRVFQSTGALVVRQTEAGHYALEKYLKKRAIR
ncbi:hypothetical protein [Planctopirus hydrillae]|uniref:Uncharacterized protein n=1 Tax=Planctopirus hydrillae TaxID=1841610 RepID=A0A1C3EN15_9PLAN|nr:hypothetical protein [Planctopirus hydrillae]ODA34643.1 hypothetical protein A6X21_02890 [Planctopirus hydrillae]